MQYDVVIIGGGLGGLECGYLLSKKGLSVCVIEKNARAGGCLQNFTRNGLIFDTGFHYVGGLAEGQPLNRIFDYFGLLNLPWKQLDTECFDEVILNGEHYRFANGYDTFSETLLLDYEKNGHTVTPQLRQGMKAYSNLLKKIGETTFDRLHAGSLEHLATESYFSKSIYKYLEDTIGDENMIGILGGTSLKMELRDKTLPLYTFTQINSSFVQSAWRLRGGGEQIADSLAASIKAMGGKVLTHLEVTRIVERDGKATAVEIGEGEYIEGRVFISNLHPGLTLSLISKENSSIKNIFRRRISNLDNTFGMFTANIRLKENSLPYLNRNIFVHREGTDMWANDQTNRPIVNSLMVSFYPDQPALDLLTPMRWSEVANLQGEDYRGFKAQKTEECLQLAEQRLPGLREAIDQVYTSSPLTYQRFTGTAEGSAYGIRKDWRSPVTTVLAPKTPVENVLLTGQNLNLHGVLGVSMTSVITAAQVIGMETIVKDLQI